MHCIEDGALSSKAFILLLSKATVHRPQGRKLTFSLLCQTIIPTTDVNHCIVFSFIPGISIGQQTNCSVSVSRRLEAFYPLIDIFHFLLSFDRMD